MKVGNMLAAIGRKNILLLWIMIQIGYLFLAIVTYEAAYRTLSFFVVTFVVTIVMLPMYLWTAYESDKQNITGIENKYIIKEVKE